MNTLLHDVHYGFRMLLKHKGFTAVAVLALGLGIGANTAIFSLVNGVLLRPLPFPNSERIVYFEGKNPAAGIEHRLRISRRDRVRRSLLRGRSDGRAS